MFRQYREIQKKEFFVIFADPSAGMGDYCAVQFLSKTRLDVPLVFHSKIIATEMTNLIHPVVERLFDITEVKPTIAYERNNGGLFEMERLAALNRAGKYDIFKMPQSGRVENPDPVKLGWDTNTATRPKMLSDLKEAIDHGLLALYDKPTINELYSFVLVQTSSAYKAQAESGSHDDLIMSLAGAWQLYQSCAEPQIVAPYIAPYDDISNKDWSMVGAGSSKWRGNYYSDVGEKDWSFTKK